MPTTKISMIMEERISNEKENGSLNALLLTVCKELQAAEKSKGKTYAIFRLSVTSSES